MGVVSWLSWILGLFFVSVVRADEVGAVRRLFLVYEAARRGLEWGAVKIKWAKWTHRNGPAERTRKRRNEVSRRLRRG